MIDNISDPEIIESLKYLLVSREEKMKMQALFLNTFLRLSPLNVEYKNTSLREKETLVLRIGSHFVNSLKGIAGNSKGSLP